MKKHQYSKLGLVACIAVLAASVQVRAADMAWASGALADIYVAATEANAAVAEASGSGQKAVQAAQAKVAAIDEAIEAALAAYAAMEAAGDGPAAEATEALRQARQQALGGDAAPESPSDQDFVLPNIQDVPWESEGLRKLHNKLYQIEKSTSAEGGDTFAEREATPE